MTEDIETLLTVRRQFFHGLVKLVQYQPARVILDGLRGLADFGGRLVRLVRLIRLGVARGRAAALLLLPPHSVGEVQRRPLAD